MSTKVGDLQLSVHTTGEETELYRRDQASFPYLSVSLLCLLSSGFPPLRLSRAPRFPLTFSAVDSVSFCTGPTLARLSCLASSYLCLFSRASPFICLSPLHLATFIIGSSLSLHCALQCLLPLPLNLEQPRFPLMLFLFPLTGTCQLHYPLPRLPSLLCAPLLGEAGSSLCAFLHRYSSTLSALCQSTSLSLFSTSLRPHLSSSPPLYLSCSPRSPVAFLTF